MRRAIVALLVLALAWLACGGDEEAEPAAPAGPQAYGLGQAVQVEDWTLTVHGVEYPSGGDWEPEAGHKFVMVDVELTNRSNESQMTAVGGDMELKDSQNRSYGHHIAIAAPADEPDGEFAAGETKRGPVVFEVPEDAAGFVLVFDPGILTDKVMVKLE